MTELQINYWKNYILGDDHSLGELYASIFEKLVFRAIYYTKNHEVARDIVADLFVSLLELTHFEREDRWKNILNVEALLLAIVRNKCLDYLKISRNRLRILESQKAENFNDEQEKNDLIQHLERCMNQLTDNEFKIIQLHFKGYSNREIGKNMNVAEKTIRNKLSLSRKRIIKLWNQMGILIHFLWN